MKDKENKSLKKKIIKELEYYGKMPTTQIYLIYSITKLIEQAVDEYLNKCARLNMNLKGNKVDEILIMSKSDFKEIFGFEESKVKEE